jgi:phenylpropionate dioxygenase-like ring-hydroxylating dioxygenase large terminal subunit
MSEMQIADECATVKPQLTLPSRCYTDATIYAHELETIFAHCWQLIGHAVDVKEPGSYLAGRVAEQDVVAVRGHDGVLRGLSNVCRHRGHRLLHGKGTLNKAIICPYHAWGYGLDGRLRGAPNANN